MIYTLYDVTMGACQSTPRAALPEECFICCKPVIPNATLTCGHAIHMACLASWWMQRPSAAQKMTCPLCRNESDDCLMELEVQSMMPVGFYRNGLMYRLPVKPEVITKCVRIQEDARDFAQAKAIEAWIIMLLDAEQPQNPVSAGSAI